MLVTIKLRSKESSNLNLSRQNIERYVQYKIKKIFNKPYLTENTKSVTIYLDVRNKKESTVKILVLFNKKDVVVVLKGENPYEILKKALLKIERKLRKEKEEHKQTSSCKNQESLKEIEKNKIFEEDEQILSLFEDSISDLNIDFSIPKNDECDEEDIFAKIMNEF